MVDHQHSALSHHPSSFSAGSLSEFDGGSRFKIHPHHRWLAKWFDRYMMVAALLASAVVYLQAAVIIQNKSSENVSMPSYIIWLIVSLSWMAYGILRTDWVISLSGVVASVGSVMALVATASYKPSTNPGPFTVIG